jgi:hypothetical protein
VLTAAGTLKLQRVYFTCRQCRVGVHPWDDRLGVQGVISPQARRLLCLAGASWSFDKSAQFLRELCGLSVSDNTIRAICQQEAAAMANWQRDAWEARAPFRQARGDMEFSTDGTSVNTWEGWREMRLGIFSKRHRGPSATAAEWDDRELPSPHVRVAFAAIEKSDRFGSRWGRWARRLGIHDTAQVSVLADGAGWIWEEVSVHFPFAAGVLDIYHALEHVADTAKVVYGEATVRCRRWIDSMRRVLLSGGWPAVRQRLRRAWLRVKKRSHRNRLQSLARYLGKHRQHLDYAQRLAEGRSIGSGQVEGACKHMIGRRLKQTGARWRVRRANRMANLCALMYSDHWTTYWTAK